MTEVWYCAVTNMLDDYSCRVHYQAGIREPVHESCGPRRLVPFDALVLVRDAEGNWPAWAIKKLRKLVGGHFQRDHRHPVGCDCRGEASILDALAEAAKENPQW